MAGQAGDLCGSEPTHGERGEMRHHGPWRAKLRAGGQHQTESGARYLVDEQTQQFQGGGIDPMQIFYNHQHWLLPRFRREPGQQGLQGLLALPLGVRAKAG